MDKKQNYIRSLEFRKDATIVCLAGDVTFDTLKEIQEEFRSKTEGKNIRNIIFDLKDISETDTSGVAALVDLMKYMKIHNTGGKIGLINVSAKIKSLLLILKTEPLFVDFQSEEDAIAGME